MTLFLGRLSFEIFKPLILLILSAQGFSSKLLSSLWLDNNLEETSPISMNVDFYDDNIPNSIFTSAIS